MPPREFVAGTSFQIRFEPLGLVKRFERGIEPYFPRGKLCSVGTPTGIVIGKAAFEIGGVTSVKLGRVFNTLKNVRVKHVLNRMACHP